MAWTNNYDSNIFSFLVVHRYLLSTFLHRVTSIMWFLSLSRSLLNYDSCSVRCLLRVTCLSFQVTITGPRQISVLSSSSYILRPWNVKHSSMMPCLQIIYAVFFLPFVRKPRHFINTYYFFCFSGAGTNFANYRMR